MSDKADHLIERAAALLRSAAPSKAPESAAPDGDLPPPLPPGVPPLVLPQAVPQGRSQSPQAQMPATAPGRRVAARTATGGSLAVPGAITSAAQIPRSPSRPPITVETLEHAGLMVARSSRTRIAEEYRIVIGRVLRALHDEPDGEARWEPVASNVVMVTSARPGEGKSFSALNIAASIAQNAAESVLLVDVDSKMQPISEELALREAPGFMDLIAQPELPLDDVIYPTEIANLAFLPLGSRLRRAPEEADSDLSTLGPITPVIHRLGQRYPKSLIMLDAPPCLSTSDPHTIAPHVGQIVMVVEAERTQRSDVEAALDLVRVCPNITMLLNKVRMTPATTFGAYDYFGSYT